MRNTLNIYRKLLFKYIKRAFELARAGVWYTDHITAEDPERNFLVGRTYCCSFPGQKKEEKKQFSEGEPDVRGSFKPVRSPCLYQGISDIKR